MQPPNQPGWCICWHRRFPGDLVLLDVGGAFRGIRTGELYKIFDWERPSCTVHGEGCPFWSGFEECARSDLLSRIAARSGRSTILVTNSRKQLDGVSVLPPDVQVRYLWLVRDGRAVTASMLRKQAVSGMSAAVNDWAPRFESTSDFCVRLPRRTT
ncbi:MAG: hypothetical protein ACOX52_17150 [Verrucomicrobiota bacterium]